MTQAMIKIVLEFYSSAVLDDPVDMSKAEISELIQTCEENGVDFWSCTDSEIERERIRELLKNQ
jgi:hypothetical protein